HAQSSPDGRWLAYQSDESGRPEIYVRSFGAGDGKWMISQGGGDFPSWSSDGRRLHYQSFDRKLMAVHITANKTIQASPPKEVFPLPRGPGAPLVANDGRVLLIAGVGQSVQSPFTIVLNWPSLLKK